MELGEISGGVFGDGLGLTGRRGTVLVERREGRQLKVSELEKLFNFKNREQTKGWDCRVGVEYAKERAVGKKGMELEVRFCVSDINRARKIFWEGVGGRGESGSWDVW